MNAELLAIGSELLGPLRAETNSLWLTEKLLDAGVAVSARVTVADDLGLIASAFRAALSRADVVVSTGGLGPTADDLTREAAAAATGRELRRDSSILEGLRERFARYGRAMSETNARQADLVAGAEPLANPRGTAPGQRIQVDGRQLFLLPGPPAEMKPMFESAVLPVLRARLGATAVVRRRVLKIASMPEGEVDQVLAPVYSRFDNPKTTILGSPGQVELHLVAQGKDAAEAEAAIAGLKVALDQALPGRIYGDDGRDLPAIVLEMLAARGLTLAVAESCTGGLLAARLTDVPGSSRVLERGYVTYSNQAKTDELGVPAALVERVGAVSEAVAAAMAEGARLRAGTSAGVGITGIAGPDGGTPEKPVGLVFVAIDGAAGSALRRCLFPGARDRVRYQATQVALEMLRRGLLGLAPL